MRNIYIGAIMKTRQHNQRVIVLEQQNESDIIAFIQKNAILLTHFVLNFKSPISPSVESVLNELNLCYFIGVVGSKPSQNDIDKLNAQSEPSTQQNPQQKAQSSKNPLDSTNADSKHTSPNISSAISPATSFASSPKIIHKIRSGEEISAQGSLSILGDITSGAKVSASGSVTVFGDCYGVLEVGGEFLILRSLQSGYISFNNEILSADMLAKINANDKLKIIIKEGANIVIKDITN